MKKFTLHNSDGVFQGNYTEAECQAYMDQYGAFYLKQPMPENLEFILNLIGGANNFKLLMKNVKESVKEIKKVFKNMKPKKEYPELLDYDPDEE